MLRLGYYPWLTQNILQQVIAEKIGVYARLIEQKLASAGTTETVQVMPPVDVPEQIQQVVAGTVDIALMNPLGLVFARNANPNAEAVAVAKRIIDGQVGVVYFSQLYTHKKNAIKALPKAAGLSVGYGVPFSTSNFLIPAFMLQKAGVHPLLGFGRVEFLKGHEIVARAVYEGKVDVGAGHDGVIIDLANQRGYGDAEDVLVQLKRSEPIPSDPVVVTTPDPGKRALLQRAIVDAGETPEGKEALKVFWGNVQGLADTTSQPYMGLADALKALKLEQADVIPPR
jgi:phosphate/phosphite/phosphonate ABC transporter binding protein